MLIKQLAKGTMNTLQQEQAQKNGAEITRIAKKYHMSDLDILEVYRELNKLPNIFEIKLPMQGEHYKLLIEKVALATSRFIKGEITEEQRERIYDEVHQELATAREDVAQQCYLECLTIECGEGECARAIRTKFNLKGLE